MRVIMKTKAQNFTIKTIEYVKYKKEMNDV